MISDSIESGLMLKVETAKGLSRQTVSSLSVCSSPLRNAVRLSLLHHDWSVNVFLDVVSARQLLQDLSTVTEGLEGLTSSATEEA